jgi:predicted ArsR family transcriptional regulator
MSHAQGQDNWTLLTAHGRTLVAIAQDPDARMRDLAEVVGVTERTVQAIVADLETAGYVARSPGRAAQPLHGAPGPPVSPPRPGRPPDRPVACSEHHRALSKLS